MDDPKDDPKFLHLAAHESILEVAKKYALAGMEGIPSALVIDAKGEGHPMATFFKRPGDKDAFAAKIRAEVAKREAICAAFASESWMTVLPPGETPTTPPSQSRGRLEVIAVHSEGRDGMVLDSMVEIIRDAGGKAVAFEQLFKERRERGDLPAAQGESRFSGFFPADA